MNEQDPIYLGLDVGGTKVAAGVVNGAGEVLSRLQVSTSDLRAGGDPLAGLIGIGRRLLEPFTGTLPAGVGLALPGPVERSTLRMLAAPTIPEFEDVALAAPLEAAFRCPVAGDNDANGCALAEARFGAGRGCPDVVYFTVSTGIGGGIVRSGSVLRGSRGTSGEFGHQVILPEGGPACDCGGSGCLEALASGRGIARRAMSLAAGKDPFPEWAARGTLDAATVAAAARTGDPLARKVWDDTATYLGIGISNVVNILDPDVVVLGGGVATGSEDLLFAPVRSVVRERCMPSLRRETPIVPARLGGEVGIIGAVSLLLEAIGTGRDGGLPGANRIPPPDPRHRGEGRAS